MPKIFFFAGFIILVVPFIIWFLRQIFTPEELGEVPEKETLDSQLTLREKQLLINEEVSDLKKDLTQLEHETDAEKRKAQKTIEEVDKIPDDIEEKLINYNPLIRGEKRL